MFWLVLLKGGRGWFELLLREWLDGLLWRFRFWELLCVLLEEYERRIELKACC